MIDQANQKDKQEEDTTLEDQGSARHVDNEEKVYKKTNTLGDH